jgi:hypothetical protein
VVDEIIGENYCQGGVGETEHQPEHPKAKCAKNVCGCTFPNFVHDMLLLTCIEETRKKHRNIGRNHAQDEFSLEEKAATGQDHRQQHDRCYYKTKILFMLLLLSFFID